MPPSRLDRLVTLLETGSTALIRNTAAQQLADVQKNHPDELFNLLTRVVPYLRSRSWDTRTAAAKAIGGIVDHAEKYDPNATPDAVQSSEADEKTTATGSQTSLVASADQLQLSTLDVESILAYGKELLSSAGKQYDVKLAGLTPSERLAHQKKTLTARLGLGGEYMDEELMSERDIAIRTSSLPTPVLSTIDTDVSRTTSQSVGDDAAVKSPEDGSTPTQSRGGEMSKRQLNMLKRRRKEELKRDNKKFKYDFAQRRTSSSMAALDADTPAELKVEPTENGNGDYLSMERTAGDDDSKIVSEFKGIPMPEPSTLVAETEQDGREWPFDRLCEFLTVDLFDPSWEIRHGAAMGLREIVRAQGAGAGRRADKTRSENDVLNQAWLDDLACRTCCVFMLDRFADYVSDNAVAPIRETSGQVLGAVLQHLPSSSVRDINHILYRLVMQKDLKVSRRIWHACHGGMIGMRYLVAVRADLLFLDQSLIDGVLECVVKGLGDHDDDVRSVSAATLIPVADEFVRRRPAELPHLIGVVWECLSSLSDDLSASTGSVMDLLARLCSFPEVLHAMRQNAQTDSQKSFNQLVPRLYPFLRHTITSVRSAVLRALLTFVGIDNSDAKGWINGKAMRLVYQNLLVERNEGVLKLSLDVWNAIIETMSTKDPAAFRLEFEPHAGPLIALTLHPLGVSRQPIAMDCTLFMRPSGQHYAPLAGTHHTSPLGGSEPGKKRRRSDKKEAVLAVTLNTTHNIDAAIMQGDIDLVGADVMIKTRIFSTRALGKALALWPAENRTEFFGNKLLPGLKSRFASTRVFAAMALEEFAHALPTPDDFSTVAGAELTSLVEKESAGAYGDQTSFLKIARAQCQQLLNAFCDNAHVAAAKLPTIAVICQGEPEAGKNAFSLADAERIVNQDYERLKKGLSTVQRMSAADALSTARMDAETAMKAAQNAKRICDFRIRAAAAAALVPLGQVPKKPQSCIRGIMESVHDEENVDLQHRSAHAIAALIHRLLSSDRSRIVEKIVNNLIRFCCAETGETPGFHSYVKQDDVPIVSLQKDEEIYDRADATEFERAGKAARITRRGAKGALERLCGTFGAEVLDKVPKLRSLLEDPIRACFSGALPADLTEPENPLGQQAVDAISSLRALISSLHTDLHAWVLDLVPCVVTALHCDFPVFRYTAAKCLASICSVMPVQGFTLLVEKVLPSISHGHEVAHRQGAIECIYHLIQVMGDGILPYVIFLLVPVLGRMSDSDPGVRLIATTAFATLVKLVPLEAGIPDPPGLPATLLEGRDRERKFIAQMLDPKKVEPFDIPVAIKAELRSYQREGVSWLHFLNRYNLHGVLCDDMGLGKTLQTLCIVASDHHMRAEDYAKTQAPDMQRLPSLIVCPPTLTGHWKQEILTYAPFLTAVAYAGPPSERGRVRSQLSSVDVVITSYDIARNDIEILAPINWNYCVLDEGHLIKNPKAKVTMAVKRLPSNHRLILSGTPIQNNVLELWSLFDFLMPGFLGTEKIFQDRFARPIAAGRFAKASSKEQEASALAIESLHKQVLPFLLRRLKEEVLNDLPPKILQNYYCDLSDLQKKLFEDFHSKEAKSLQDMAGSADKEAKQHIFQALQYMRKLCNSPAMVMKEGHKQYAATQALLARQGSSLQDAKHAPKLTALRDLLVDCGIGVAEPTAGAVPSADQAVSQHRALIFCQMKEMLDMVESSVLKKMLPSVTFSRLDGSVEASKRQDIVNRFNSDPSIDCLLLTTSVGGLGLNLTGADTVIFVEHDWNPQKDLQAMDRAHRIGQKKVVNVYRLITRGTLEEKILGLQRFKIDVAATVVNQQNAGLASMQTDQILDLFHLGDTDPTLDHPDPMDAVDESNAVDAEGNVKEKGKRGVLDELAELWDDSQYEEEFNLDGFLKTMKA